jgi:UMF1 family MFS transporter
MARTAHPWLERFALHRPELRAWALYDWANSAMVTTIVASVFPVYYRTVAAAGLPAGVATQRFALSTTLALIVIALFGPFLGAIGDAAGARKKLLGVCLGLGVAATAGMFWVGPGDWRLASLLLILAQIGAAGSFVFYDALLVHVARRGEMDRLSTTSYALGYLGGGLLLALQFAWIRAPERFGLDRLGDWGGTAATLPARLAFLSVAVWWLLFALPLFRHVQEPPATGDTRRSMRAAATAALYELGATWSALRRYPQALGLLLAFLFYNDGISTIVKMAAIYGAEIGLEANALLGAILLVQFVGIPCALGFGALAQRIGAQRALLGALVIYAGIGLFATRLRTEAHFFALAFAVGTVQGGAQALSRSLFASLIPPARAAEFFGFFALLEKFSGILGPACFAGAIALTGSSRAAVATVIPFFLIGAVLLRRVRVDEGRRAVALPESS